MLSLSEVSPNVEVGEALRKVRPQLSERASLCVHSSQRFPLAEPYRLRAHLSSLPPSLPTIVSWTKIATPQHLL